MQKEQSDINRIAWNYRAYEWWEQKSGTPQQAAQAMKQNPQQHLKGHLAYLGDVKGKRIANLLGSNGRKAVPLALLGAEVTVVDISAENQRYALALAKEAGVELAYIVADVCELDMASLTGSFDLVYLEGGILHYFSDLHRFAGTLFALLKTGGRLILNDFHPFARLVRQKGEDWIVQGDYSATHSVTGEVAYKNLLSAREGEAFPDCLLRYPTMGEIISAVAGAGLFIATLDEEPAREMGQRIPATFTLVAVKKEGQHI